MSYQVPQIDNIEDYLRQHEDKDMLRFITCGSVDDGKSTLIGRLLHDSKVIFEDQLAAITRDSARHGTTGEEVDLALLVDGLQSEREQGITIDVAYRFFATDHRKYIIADTPGHEQYTRNMATGASTADVAVLLIDARHGVQVQTRRHSFICSLLGIRHFIIAINKMDLVDYSQERFESICSDYRQFVSGFQVPDVQFVPMSALKGVNVVHRGTEWMPWYTGPALLEILDHLPVLRQQAVQGLRFPVQYVSRPNLDFRGYCGTLAAGSVRPGDAIRVLPSGVTSTVRAVVTFEGDQPAAHAGQAVTLTLNDEIDISRGDLIVAADDTVSMGHGLDVHLVWMHEQPLIPGKIYDFKLGPTFTSGLVSEIVHQIDVNTLERSAATELPLNGIARCHLQLNRATAFDAYDACKATGSLIIIDRLTNVTVGAGMVLGPAPLADEKALAEPVTAAARARRLGHDAGCITVSGEQAESVAEQLERQLFAAGMLALRVPARAADSVPWLLQAGLVVVRTGVDKGPLAVQLERQGQVQPLPLSAEGGAAALARRILSAWRQSTLD